MERREEYLKLLEKIVQPSTVDLVKQCLHNAQEMRPESSQVLLRVRELRGTVSIDNRANGVRTMHIYTVPYLSGSINQGVLYNSPCGGIAWTPIGIIHNTLKAISQL